MTTKTKAVIGALLAGIATTFGLLGAGEAEVISSQTAATITTVLNAILGAGIFLPAKKS